MEVKEGMASPGVPQTSVVAADHNTGITEEVTIPVTESSMDEEEDARWIKELKENCERAFKGVPCQFELQPDKKKDHKISKIRKSAPSEEEFVSQPRMVTIGPFHRDDERMMIIADEEKCLIVCLMNHLYDLDLADYLTKKKNQVAKAREFYSGLDTSRSFDSKDENKFAEMLLLDSYFILFMLTYTSEIRSRVTCDAVELFRSDSSKRVEIMLGLNVVPRFANILHHKDEIMVDLLILKNQIPFFVIEDLFKKLKLKKHLHKYALEFFKRIHPRSTRGCRCQNSTPPELSHLLHLFHWSRVPATNKDNNVFKSSWRPQLGDFYWVCSTPTATKLKESTTVLFKKKTSGSSNSLDITFRRSRLIPTVLVISIPRLHIHEYSSRIFHNLIAFEKQYCPRSDRQAMFFSAIMHNLLQSEEDVKLLRRRRILVNTCTADYKIVNFFKSLSRTTEKNDMPNDVYVFCRQVQCYHNRRMSRMSRFYYANINAILKCFPN